MSEEQGNILIVGSGGREHALAWKIRQSPDFDKIFIAPGNGGTEAIGTNVDIDQDDINGLARFAAQHSVGLTVIGPEGPLEKGIVNAFEEEGLPVFGPSQAAAKLETDKSWAMEFMSRHGIPHPASVSFRDADAAMAYVESVQISGIVIKAAGLAGGKGVFLPESRLEAKSVINDILNRRVFGEAGNEILIQERLHGPEVSVLAITDGSTVIPLLPAADHKRIHENDRGPNTGGMGAYAPVPSLSAQELQNILNDILQPAVDGMRKEGIPYKGILYAGLMMTRSGPKVLEFNARFGDPETQPLMMLLQSDLATALLHSIQGTLSRNDVRFRKGAAVCVIAASHGYPGSYEKGVPVIEFPHQKHRDVEVFHAGTILRDGKLVTNGGRVMGVTARGMSLKVAIHLAYEELSHITFEGMQYRRDIGTRGLEANA